MTALSAMTVAGHVAHYSQPACIEGLYRRPRISPRNRSRIIYCIRVGGRRTCSLIPHATQAPFDYSDHSH